MKWVSTWSHVAFWLDTFYCPEKKSHINISSIKDARGSWDSKHFEGPHGSYSAWDIGYKKTVGTMGATLAHSGQTNAIVKLLYSSVRHYLNAIQDRRRNMDKYVHIIYLNRHLTQKRGRLFSPPKCWWPPVSGIINRLPKKRQNCNRVLLCQVNVEVKCCSLPCPSTVKLVEIFNEILPHPLYSPDVFQSWTRWTALWVGYLRDGGIICRLSEI